MRHTLKRVAAAAVLAGSALAGSQASAAVVYDQTQTFNQTVADNAPVRFSASFDFTTLALDAIDSIQLTLNYSGVGNALCVGTLCLGSEAWFVRAQGGTLSSSSDDYFGRLTAGGSTVTFTLSSLTDTGSINAFAHSVANQIFTFWFSEQTLGVDSFTLASARLVVNGTEASPVPLPAAAPMLMAGLGGLAMLRRRRGTV
ncbi:MAG: VPLPA-CTERM sorting domain-containing protein [Paracoccaceae bacterium]